MCADILFNKKCPIICQITYPLGYLLCQKRKVASFETICTWEILNTLISFFLEHASQAHWFVILQPLLPLSPKGDTVHAALRLQSPSLAISLVVAQLPKLKKDLKINFFLWPKGLVLPSSSDFRTYCFVILLPKKKCWVKTMVGLFSSLVNQSTAKTLCLQQDKGMKEGIMELGSFSLWM